MTKRGYVVRRGWDDERIANEIEYIKKWVTEYEFPTRRNYLQTRCLNIHTYYQLRLDYPEYKELTDQCFMTREESGKKRYLQNVKKEIEYLEDWAHDRNFPKREDYLKDRNILYGRIDYYKRNSPEYKALYDDVFKHEEECIKKWTHAKIQEKIEELKDWRSIYPYGSRTDYYRDCGLARGGVQYLRDISTDFREVFDETFDYHTKDPNSRKWTPDRLDRLSHDLEEWMNNPNHFWVHDFYETVGITSKNMEYLCNKCPKLKQLYLKAKEKQKNKLIKKGLSLDNATFIKWLLSSWYKEEFNDKEEIDTQQAKTIINVRGEKGEILSSIEVNNGSD